jgi:hypothetical protein
MVAASAVHQVLDPGSNPALSDTALIAFVPLIVHLAVFSGHGVSGDDRRCRGDARPRGHAVAGTSRPGAFEALLEGLVGFGCPQRRWAALLPCSPAAAMDPFYLLLPRRPQLSRWPRLSQAALRRDGEELNEVSAQRHLFEESARIFPSATGKRAFAGAREEARQLVAGKLGHELSRHQLA